MEYIFVYGTLKKAYRHLNVYTNLFHEGTEWMEDAQVSGTLYLMDWYPALKMNSNEPVYGEMYRIVSPDLLTVLDQYEHAIQEQDYLDKIAEGVSYIDADYIRKSIPVNAMECWIYEYIPNVSESTRIAGGMFRL